ncbi:site-specific integrase [Streptomyces sp. NPDC004561]
MRVVKERDGGVVRRVRLVDGDGEPLAAACRFLDHLVDRGFSPHTICAYAYDLRRLFTFLAAEGMDWRQVRGPDALRLLAFLRRAPSRRPAQRLGLTVVVGGPEAPGSLLSPATVNRILAAVSSFYDWAVVAEEYDGDSPMQKRLDPALARVPDRHQPFNGRSGVAPATTAPTSGTEHFPSIRARLTSSTTPRSRNDQAIRLVHDQDMVQLTGRNQASSSYAYERSEAGLSSSARMSSRNSLTAATSTPSMSSSRYDRVGSPVSSTRPTLGTASAVTSRNSVRSCT